MTNEAVFKTEKKPIVASPLPKVAVRLIVTGVVLLALTVSGVSIFPLIAPLLFVSGFGLLLMTPANNSTSVEPSNWSFLAAPGAMLVALGAMITVLNLIGHPEAFSYLWTVLPITFTAGMMHARRFESGHPIHINGARVIRVLSIIGVSMGVIFELFIFETFGRWWPLILIGYGVYLLFSRRDAAETS